MNGLVADDQADQVSGVRQLRVRRPVHRSVEARVEEEGLEHRRGDLALGRIVALVVGLHDLGFLLEGRVLFRPAEGLVDLLGGQEGREDRGVRLRVHGLHERDVRVDGLLVRGARVGDKGDCADGALQGVQQSQAGKHAVRHQLLVRVQGFPGLNVVRQRHFFRQPEVAGEAIPDLEVLLVLNAVPVDRFKNRLSAHWSSFNPGCASYPSAGVWGYGHSLPAMWVGR